MILIMLSPPCRLTYCVVEYVQLGIFVLYLGEYLIYLQMNYCTLVSAPGPYRRKTKYLVTANVSIY